MKSDQTVSLKKHGWVVTLKQGNKKATRRSLFRLDNAGLLDVAHDVREDVTNRRAKQGEDNDHDNGDQDQDQSVFDQTLAFFTGHVNHGIAPK
jgi:hypothetical protein